jgi:hypothetical protein
VRYIDGDSANDEVVQKYLTPDGIGLFERRYPNWQTFTRDRPPSPRMTRWVLKRGKDGNTVDVKTNFDITHVDLQQPLAIQSIPVWPGYVMTHSVRIELTNDNAETTSRDIFAWLDNHAQLDPRICGLRFIESWIIMSLERLRAVCESRRPDKTPISEVECVLDHHTPEELKTFLATRGRDLVVLRNGNHGHRHSLRGLPGLVDAFRRSCPSLDHLELNLSALVIGRTIAVEGDLTVPVSLWHGNVRKLTIRVLEAKAYFLHHELVPFFGIAQSLASLVSDDCVIEIKNCTHVTRPDLMEGLVELIRWLRRYVMEPR